MDRKISSGRRSPVSKLSLGVAAFVLLLLGTSWGIAQAPASQADREPLQRQPSWKPGQMNVQYKWIRSQLDPEDVGDKARWKWNFRLKCGNPSCTGAEPLIIVRKENSRTLLRFRPATRVPRGTPFTEIKWKSQSFDQRNWFGCVGDNRKIWGSSQVTRIRLKIIKRSGKRYLWGLKGKIVDKYSPFRKGTLKPSCEQLYRKNGLKFGQRATVVIGVKGRSWSGS